MQLSEGTAQQLVDQLDRAPDIASETLVLRKIKNNVSGHELRKIVYIRAGLVPVLTDVLLARNAISGDVSFHTFLPQEEALWWHASSIILVLANAGTTFTHALLDGNLLSCLIARLLVTDPAERVALGIIECLNAIANNLPLCDEQEWSVDQTLNKTLYTSENAACLTRFVAILPDTWPAQQRLTAVLSLICKTCHSEKDVAVLVAAGLLDILCEHLANSILAQGVASRNQRSRIQDMWHERNSYIPLILETVALITENSKLRTHEFASHDAIREALGTLMNTYAEREAGCDSLVQLDVAPSRPSISSPLDADATAANRGQTSTWPPLSFPVDELSSITRSTLQKPSSGKDEAHESWLNTKQDDSQHLAPISWLLYMARNINRRVRIMAAKILVIFKSHHAFQGQTLRSLTALLVPVLVDLIDKQPTFSQAESDYTEQVPAILAMLVRDHEFLQQAAVDANAIPKLAAALRANFENPSDVPNAVWWPSKLQVRLTEGGRERCLGLGGPSRQMRLQMQFREGLLKALAALAPDSDVFRKDICDHGALNHIILALEPFRTRTVVDEYCDRIVVTGNSSDALIAACGAVRALTRSPTSLRTKIVDADVAKHIIKLLYTAEPAVRVAATMVIANLSHGFSPMNSSIAESSVIKKLCEQAHSANAPLRRETLFALKAFIIPSSNTTKRMVVEELGVNWIRHLIATDPHDVPAGDVIGLVERDYQKGSRIRLRDDASLQNVNTTDVKQNPEDYNHHTLEQDLEIQAELLGFLRNLTTGDNSADIIDYIMEEMGHDEFLQIMVDRLKASAGNQSPSASKILQNSIYVIVHIAVADARYRSPIAHNLVLMKQINNLLAHSEAAIRRACCWLIIGVVYSPSESHLTTIPRARDLERLGIMENLRRMEKNDLDTDVKERASTAREIFSKLLQKT